MVATTNKPAAEIYGEHKKAWEDWPHGDISETKYDDNGYLCIRYKDGVWYHYGLENNHLVWW